VVITDGPYQETKGHIGGFLILEAADMDEALAWARKGAVACRAPVEMRQLFLNPDRSNGAAVTTLPENWGGCADIVVRQ
jgi:hypothetical protein